MALREKCFALSILLLFVSISHAANWGEININFGTDLVSKTASKDLENYPSGYEPDGLTNLKQLADTGEIDGYWGHRKLVLVGIEYMHSLFNYLKIGIGTKIIKKDIEALYYAVENKGPSEPPTSGGGISILPVDFAGDAALTKLYKELYLLPTYFTVQLSPLSDKFNGICFRANMGYNFIIKDDLFGKANYYNASSLWEYKREGGLYFGLEIGNEFKLKDTIGFILGIFYDYILYKSVLTDVGTFHGPLKHAELTNIDHIFGIKTGIKFRL
jgi:hypothetical protein